jgi:ubiquinone/menaquinone biosynthesis C-methylase UbiE
VMAMSQNPGKIAALYDKVAKEYAEHFRDEHQSKPKDREMLQRFAREIGGRRPVWDLGCGPGQTTKYLTGLGLRVSGLDLSEKILEQAKANHPGIGLLKGSILELGFKSNSIAGAVAFYAIVHFSPEQVGMAFREIFRVLQPGGLFLCTFHIGQQNIHLNEFLGKQVDIDVMFFAPDFISGCLEDCGFEQIEMIQREPYPDVEYPSQRAYVFAVKPA